ncbi:RNA-binding S4 domain-containing protein [Enterococcus hulanensis]|jgi:ribosomal 50S subunit-recycling heat shock protein|uniref:RQC P-site tRNA stabilizing factor n=2 Tax=Enterococcus TaxID=1350 RepID=A0ABS3HMH9_9ENTE|nr:MULTISPECIES: RNA-binding S4 domain-containing protein [Enterococcus]MBO0409765.1 RNA-binding S4 domain-containing protein [Enterococcus hulanensis]MBO0453798.1 RNA-binding S4 domain-containing protein [Enterococcus sp. MJM16]MBO0459695.1 RNA-binding S4 domain-containing protein [Enterococcus hulanensis]MBX8937571.1 RNA-binding S4 domain-containing protein [Enterococcus gilvus]MDT2600099.1 RNA-binding S4 domain-containing protein [Enterococcus hulanensis]
MRLDKFLKISRIIKRRTVAKEVADKGRIQVNGKLAKSSTDVKVGDQLRIQFGNKVLEVAVEELHESTKKDDAAKMYRIISETRVENNGN